MYRDDLTIYPHTPQLLNPTLVHPMSAFVARAFHKQFQKTKQSRIVIQTSNRHGRHTIPACEARHQSLPKAPQYHRQSIEFDGLIKRNYNQQNSSVGKKPEQVTIVDELGVNVPTRNGDKLQTEDEPDSIHNRIKRQTVNLTYFESKKLIQQLRGRNTHDIDKTKVILQNMLTGMQHKVDEIGVERHMKIKGMQIRAKNIEPQLRGDRIVVEREQSKSLIEDTPKRETQTQHVARRKQSPSSDKKKIISQNSIRVQAPSNNFKFSMSDYSQLSREQLFQLKLMNYHHFLFVVSVLSNFYTPAPVVAEFRLKIGRGNNSLLIKEIFKNRWWWNLQPSTDLDMDMNFIWTQLKVPSYMVLQDLSKQHHNHRVKSASQSATDKQRRRLVQTPKDGKKIEKIQDPLRKLMSEYSAQQLHTVERSLQDYMKHIEKHNINIVKVDNLRIHNHIERNYHLGNKKALFYNMKKYYELTNQQVFSHLPVTFHIQKGLQDKAYKQFLQFYQSLGKKQSTWIIKPGEITNRGNGIIVCSTLQEINKIVSKKQTHPNGKPFTYLIQQYMEKPLLYNKRKFDIRCYFLITQLNNVMRAYWYEEGYIRTASEEFSLKDCDNQYVHLTNDAVQKYCDDYGKYENGNKLSFTEFQRYLDMWLSSDRIDFQRDIYPIMRQIATNAIKSVYHKMEPYKRDHNFEIFGLDFMIDEQYKPWLIEINTNPCLELSCPLLGRLIPAMVENSLRLSLDTIVPPPDATVWPPCRKHLILYDNVLENNKYQLIFDELEDAEELKQLYLNECREDAIDEMDEDEEEYKSDND